MKHQTFKDIEQMAKDIRIQLAALNKNYKWLSEQTGYPTRTINRMLNGLHDFSIQEVCKLESVLNCKLIIVPNKERVIKITMNIDDSAHVASLHCEVKEDGKKKEEFTTAELASTANALTIFAQHMIEGTIFKAHEDRKKLTETENNLQLHLGTKPQD